MEAGKAVEPTDLQSFPKCNGQVWTPRNSVSVLTGDLLVVNVYALSCIQPVVSLKGFVQPLLLVM